MDRTIELHIYSNSQSFCEHFYISVHCVLQLMFECFMYNEAEETELEANYEATAFYCLE